MRKTRFISITGIGLSFVLVVFGITRMVPAGLAGDVGKVKFYFAWVAAGCIIGIPATIAYYYVRAKAETYSPSDAIEIQTLSNLDRPLHDDPKEK